MIWILGLVVLGGVVAVLVGYPILCALSRHLEHKRWVAEQLAFERLTREEKSRVMDAEHQARTRS